MSGGHPRILFLLPYPVGRAPSQRFRVEAFLPLLDAGGISYTLRPFMTEQTWNVLYKGGSAWQKATGILKGYLQRFRTVTAAARSYDYIFIHREASPLGPPVFEWYLARVLRKKIIYDFDDAIWIPNTSAENRLAAGLKAFWKVGRICSWATIVAGGNDYLCQYARSKGAKKVVRIPTVVDTSTRYNQLKAHHSGKPVVGWTGSHSTLKYLDDLVPLIRDMQETADFTFMVIADKVPDIQLKDWVFVPWNAETEISDLLRMDIGIMPLTPDAWSEGKCGFKLIQYMALGIPAVASPVGVNQVIIKEGINGYLASKPDEWREALLTLIAHPEQRRTLGIAGRQTVQEDYSITAVQAAYLGLFSTPEVR